jgi:hypothetical protein
MDYGRTCGVGEPYAEWKCVSEDAGCDEIALENGVVIEGEPENAEKIDEIGYSESRQVVIGRRTHSTTSEHHYTVIHTIINLSYN